MLFKICDSWQQGPNLLYTPRDVTMIEIQPIIDYYVIKLSTLIATIGKSEILKTRIFNSS